MTKKSHLYHGTLARYLPAIAANGLLPMVGPFTEKSYGRQSDRIVPAVFMAADGDLERVVHAMVAAIMFEVTEEDFARYDIGNDYHLNDDLFFEYGALAVIDRNDRFSRAGKPNPGVDEPFQVEDGDWYSLEPVRPANVLSGESLRLFLAERNLTPSSINDFVDPDSIEAGSRPIKKPPLDLY
ncbi:hypothetical protein HFN89_06685 [Rhizobium laguerreae]|nr:hypothetical protein [Rhizobium laguerreae]